MRGSRRASLPSGSPTPSGATPQCHAGSPANPSDLHMYRSNPLRPTRGLMRFIVLLLLALSACARADAELATKPVAPPIHVPLVVAVEAATPDVLTLTGELAADQRSEVTA